VKFVSLTTDRIMPLFFGGIGSYVAVLRDMFVLMDGHVKTCSCRGYNNSVNV